MANVRHRKRTLPAIRDSVLERVAQIARRRPEPALAGDSDRVPLNQRASGPKKRPSNQPLPAARSARAARRRTREQLAA